ncbi:hypothetical protein ABIB57_002547 [Devosia sp. UYZn731]|uniref:hypothetical protein n=1 Tax=Devosia sp. UYZn731 TaxID=3156345 RepID=UPI00339630E5
MNKPVKAIIIIAVVALIAAGAWRATSFFSGVFDDLFAQSREVAALSDQAAIAIVADWDPQSLKAFATPDYFAAQEQAGFAAWKTYQLLGKPVTLKPCTVPSLNITNGRGTASANCAATFPTGDGAISFDYNNDSGEWKITALKVAF